MLASGPETRNAQPLRSGEPDGNAADLDSSTFLMVSGLLWLMSSNSTSMHLLMHPSCNGHQVIVTFHADLETDDG